MNQLLKLPLTELEEKWLENYLLSSMESHSEELLVMYYLQRARFVDAIRLNERLKTKAFVCIFFLNSFLLENILLSVNKIMSEWKRIYIYL